MSRHTPTNLYECHNLTDAIKLMKRNANKEYAAAMRRVDLPVNNYGLACFKAGVLHEREEKQRAMNEHNWGTD